MWSQELIASPSFSFKLATKDWDKINISNSKLFKKDDLQVNSIIYSLISSPQDDGFPLSLKIEGAVSLSSTLEGKVILKVIYRARILEDSSSIETINPCTPINLTLHLGFNVNSDGQSENILDHKLFLNSSSTVDLDSSNLANGKINESKGIGLDFSGSSSDLLTHRRIGDQFPTDGIDHCHIFNQNRDLERPAAILTAPDGKTQLSFFTNQSAVQIYTGNFFDGSLPRKNSHKIGSEIGYNRFGAVFLEFQAPTGTFLHPALIKANNGDDTILRPGQIYENSVRLEILKT